MGSRGGGRQLATLPLRHGAAARSAVFPSCAAQLASDLRQSAPCEGTLSHVDATGPVVMHRAVDAACVCSPKYHLRDRPPGGTQIPPVRHSRACPPQHAVFSSSFRQHNEPGGSYTSSHVDATGPGVMHWAVDVVHPNTTSALVTPDSPPPPTVSSSFRQQATLIHTTAYRGRAGARMPPSLALGEELPRRVTVTA